MQCLLTRVVAVVDIGPCLKQEVHHGGLPGLHCNQERRVADEVVMIDIGACHEQKLHHGDIPGTHVTQEMRVAVLVDLVNVSHGRVGTTLCGAVAQVPRMSLI